MRIKTYENNVTVTEHLVHLIGGKGFVGDSFLHGKVKACSTSVAGIDLSARA
jgi:hypothetical protein